MYIVFLKKVWKVRISLIEDLWIFLGNTRGMQFRFGLHASYVLTSIVVPFVHYELLIIYIVENEKNKILLTIDMR